MPCSCGCGQQVEVKASDAQLFRAWEGWCHSRFRLLISHLQAQVLSGCRLRVFALVVLAPSSVIRLPCAQAARSPWLSTPACVQVKVRPWPKTVLSTTTSCFYFCGLKKKQVWHAPDPVLLTSLRRQSGESWLRCRVFTPFQQHQLHALLIVRTPPLDRC